MKRLLVACAGILLLAVLVSGQVPAVGGAKAQRHTFTLGPDDFLLDGKPFQIIAGEMHPARIPPQYWRHRIKMAKAMGCNTIAAYIFWNHHETSEGVFDFTSATRDIARFVRIAQEEGMWVLLRPGPYVCAEWDFGGIPTYLLKYPDLKIRCLDPRYMAAAERYIARMAAVVKPLMVASGGPVLLVQIENEYGSYGNDRIYMTRLKTVWEQNGITGPFFTGDGPTPYMLEAGHLPGRGGRPRFGLEREALGAGAVDRARRARLLVGDLPGLADALGREVGAAVARRPEEGSRVPARGEEVVQLLRHPRRHELRLHRRRQLRRQGLRARRHQLRLRRAHQRAGARDAEVPRAARDDRRRARGRRPAAAHSRPDPDAGGARDPDGGPRLALGQPAGGR